MNTKKILSVAFLALLLGSSCKNDAYRDLEETAENGVQFTSTIAGNSTTRVSGNSWDKDDAIGVFMKQGTGLSNVIAGNKKYSTAGNGNFTATGDDIINYPNEGTVDFVAYYPFKADLRDKSVAINVADQSNQSAIDVLYSNNATGFSKDSEIAKLNFKHSLSKVEITVKAGPGVTNLDGLAVTYQNILSQTSLDLASGNLTAPTTATNISTKVTAGTTGSTVEAILIPEVYGGKDVVFTIGTNSFTWKLPTTYNLEAGKKYNHTIELRTEAGITKAVEIGETTITDWVIVPGSSVILDKDKEPIKPIDPVGVEQVFFEEDFGEQGPRSNPRGRFATYSDFKNKTVKYSDLYTDSWADIRQTSTMDTHVWFPANRTTGRKIENINAAGYTKLRMTYEQAANGNNADIAALKVKINGVDYPTSGTLGGQNQFSEVAINGIASAANLTVEISAQAAENKAGYRIDNIKIFGTK
ncbi:fimbrillin family protein [Sphingobacterium hotanense]|uniref:fimbrillin family protein n=1 Tax=Sphingobacterium hotanense TaxID=649196 RepID=UPI0011F1F320|nr:fimbrillin family protein [Sphingobacterium hotanense]